jgi:hypothetical protein
MFILPRAKEKHGLSWLYMRPKAKEERYRISWMSTLPGAKERYGIS